MLTRVSLATLLALLVPACNARSVPLVDTDAGAADAAARPPPRPTDRVDLLLVVDNSGSMRENQDNLGRAFAALVNELTAATDHPVARDLHFGVVSTDLGTPGSSIPGCNDSDVGDGGLLNPIRNGRAMQEHLPWAPPRHPVVAPPGFRPDDCSRADQFPSFIRYASGATDPDAFDHDMRCNALLYVNGCGLEQPLEAVHRALLHHDARDRAGNTAPNAGFVRDDAVLAVVLLTDEEDMSVRDCRFARGAPCTDAIDVFNTGSTRWASDNLNLRGYLYEPGGPQDPTWPLDRYVDPRDASRGLFALKPDHPERVVFAAITGVPLALPRRGDGGADWDALLGAPAAGAPDDFARRDARTAIDVRSAEGPISMRQANRDPRCPDRVVPACRREGTTYDATRPACATTEQYYAWPARRVVEVARRFDEAPLCDGAPCRNGVVRSICAGDFGPAARDIAARVARRLVPGARR